MLRLPVMANSVASSAPVWTIPLNLYSLPTNIRLYIYYLILEVLTIDFPIDSDLVTAEETFVAVLDCPMDLIEGSLTVDVTFVGVRSVAF
jgi:hypothetical protein